MNSTNVRISQTSRHILRTIAQKEKIPMQAVIDRALECYRRQKFLEDANASFASLRGNADQWREEMAERSLWDRTLGDNQE